MNKGSLKIVYINGFFITKQIAGVQRFAYNILSELNQQRNICFKFILIVPMIPSGVLELFPNIQLQVMDCWFNLVNKNEILWANLVLSRLSSKEYLVNLCNLAPLLRKNQLVVLHDVIPFRYPKSCSWIWGGYFRLMSKVFVKRVKDIATVSDFSAHEICTVTHCKRNIYVLGNSGSHINKIIANNEIIDKLTLIPKKYILIVSSQAMVEHKNIQLLEMVSLDIAMPLVAVGSGSNKSGIIFARCVTDEELKSLYLNAFAFVFPSLYEGFGIPALEAMECSTPVIVADIPAFREVCGDAAIYFNPQDAKDVCAKIYHLQSKEGLIQQLVNNGNKRTKFYTWGKITEKLINIFDNSLHSE